MKAGACSRVTIASAFLGGTMERPALKRLLAEVAAGRADVIVVYKVDRPTRNLGDFSRIVDVLDAASASFVSITPAFNTTTGMDGDAERPAVLCPVRAQSHR
jgi:DNA invertase Pin-like site-specific DNA recombinase